MRNTEHRSPLADLKAPAQVVDEVAADWEQDEGAVEVEDRGGTSRNVEAAL